MEIKTKQPRILKKDAAPNIFKKHHPSNSQRGREKAHLLAQSTTSEPPSTSANTEYEPGQSVFDVKSSSSQLQSFIDQIYGESLSPELKFEQTFTSITGVFNSSSTFLGSASYRVQNLPVEGSGHHDADNLQTSIEIQCLLCETAFSHHTDFKAHSIIKHGTSTKHLSRGSHNERLKIVKCIPCKKTFTMYSRLLKHVKTGHATKRSLWFACKFCHHLFRNKRTAKEHEHKVHKNEMCFECKYCGQKFNSLRVFYEHVRSHDSMFNSACKKN